MNNVEFYLHYALNVVSLFMLNQKRIIMSIVLNVIIQDIVFYQMVLGKDIISPKEVLLHTID